MAAAGASIIDDRRHGNQRVQRTHIIHTPSNASIVMIDDGVLLHEAADTAFILDYASVLSSALEEALLVLP